MPYDIQSVSAEATALLALLGPTVGTVTGLVDGIAPVSGLLNTAVGTVEGVTGLNTAPVTGLVAGL